MALATVGIFIASMVFAPRGDAPEGEAFGGTDSAVTEKLEEAGTEPWFKPIFEPGSGEVESGLFAMQAALGAGLFGWCIGRLGRRKAADAPAALPTQQA
ncbi:MAG: energy-coupling factor ABC transporter substrate-binding protein [Propionibacteriaceae bacterium]